MWYRFLTSLSGIAGDVSSLDYGGAVDAFHTDGVFQTSDL